jgi:hypothetical protein
VQSKARKIMIIRHHKYEKHTQNQCALSDDVSIAVHRHRIEPDNAENAQNNHQKKKLHVSAEKKSATTRTQQRR